MDESMKERILYLDNVRESGNIDRALTQLTSIIETALKVGDHETAAAALPSRILCYKHLFQNTGDDLWLSMMYHDILQGFKLTLPQANFAVFHLRNADLEMLRGQYIEAEKEYETAYRLVDKTGHTAAEYRGHLAEGRSLNGKYAVAIDLLKLALREARLANDYDHPWHKSVVLSGLYARLIKAAQKNGELFLAARAFVCGYTLASWLKFYHKKPQRFNQYMQAIKRGGR